jgi:hypothetical protein
MYEICVDRIGLQIDTNQLLKKLVGDLVLDRIGRNGRFGLWILGSPYNLGHKELRGSSYHIIRQTL